MAKEKPKKGGMVLIIGMGAKPPKSKEKVKKADEEPKKKVRSRGGGKGSENKSRNTGRFRNFKRLMKKNPAHLDEVLKKTRMSKEELEQFIRLKTGANSFEEAMEQKQDIPGMIDEAAGMLAGNRGNDPLKNKKLAALLKQKGIPASVYKKYIEKNPFWGLEGNHQNLIDKLQGFKGGSTRAARNERPRGRDQRREARRASREMAEEADEEARDEQGYTDHELQTMTNILSASMPLEQARRMAARYLESGTHTEAEHTKSPFGIPSYDKIHQGTGKGGRGGAYTAANFLSQFATQRGYPGRHVEGSVSAQPSTLFSQPRTVGVKLSSPQEEEAEDPVNYGKSSDKPIDLAWALLKGNPAMKDKHGQNIDQPAAAVYENLAAHVGMGQMGNETYPDADDESVADAMESMRRSPKARKHEVGQRIHNQKSRKGITQQAIREAIADKKRLDDYRQQARDETAHDMRFGLHSNQEEDEVPYKNYGVERQDRDEVDHPNQSSRVKALLDLLDRGGNASALQLRMAQQQDKERDFGNPNLAPSQPTGTDVKMKPGNVMDLM